MLGEIPALPSRNIHFFDPANPKLRERVPTMVQDVDILLGNLEDSIPADQNVSSSLRGRAFCSLSESDLGELDLSCR